MAKYGGQKKDRVLEKIKHLEEENAALLRELEGFRRKCKLEQVIFILLCCKRGTLYPLFK